MRIFSFLLLSTYFLLPTIINAQSIDLLWQGETYTPPFYEGGTLWAKQSKLKLVAMPNGLGNASSLNYRWTRNGTVFANLSGVGKNTFTYVDTILSRSQSIKVDIISGESVLASASVIVTPITPLVLVYENNPLYGFMFHDVVSGIYDLRKREVTFGAFPLFFSSIDKAYGTINYNWLTNSGESGHGSMVTYRTPDNTYGVAEVSIHVSNPDKITQDAQSEFRVNFDNGTTSI